jgi:conjugal transfer/entry exclusion protein
MKLVGEEHQQGQENRRVMIKQILFATIASMICLSLAAQKQKVDSLNRFTQRKLSGIDTTTLKVNKATDSINSITHKLNHLQDSLKPNFGKYKSKLDSLKGKLNASDSLKPDLTKYNRKLDSIKGKLSHRIDSLKTLGLPTVKYTKLLDSLKQAGPLKNVSEAQGKIASLQNKVNEPMSKISAPVNNIENKINEKLSLMNKEGGAGANLPGNLDLPGIQTPGLTSANLPGNLDLPGIQTPGLTSTNLPGNLDLPNIQTPGLSSPGLPVTDMKLPGVGLDNPIGNINNPMEGLKNPAGEINGLGNVQDKGKDISKLPQGELGKLKEIEELGKAQDVMGQVNEVGGKIENVSGKVEGYSKEVENISTGNFEKMEEVPKALEDKVGKLEEVQGLQKEMQGIDKYKGMTDQMKDEEALKKKALEEAKKLAIDHFEGKGDKLTSAMGQISKLKQKYSSLNGLENIPKRMPNEMKGKPFIERLVPGLTLQIQKNNNVLVDFNPLIGYRISGRWTAGLGWNERVSFGKKFKVNQQDRIFGPRAFIDFKLKRGFALMATLEKMNTYVPPFNTIQVNEDSRAWVWSAFAGLKKDYQFTKGVRGNFQILYNLYDDHYNSPYADRLTVRTGFEFPLRKKHKSAK